MPNFIKYSITTPSGSLRKGNVALGVSSSLITGPTSTTGWYSGITPSTDKYVIYQTAASGDPDIYTPQTDAELIRLATSKGSNATTTGSALSFFASHSSFMSANFDYEDVVTTGLVYIVDSGFTCSYPKTGSTWYDLGGNTKDATLFNTPTYITDNSGSLRFSDTSLEYATSPDLGNLSNWTVECWFRLSSSLNGKVTSIVCNQYDLATKLNFSIGTNNAPTSFNLCAGFFDGAWHNTTGFTPSTNTWYQVVGTYDGTTIRQYVNGTADGGTLTYSGTPQSGGEVRLMRRWDSALSSVNLVNGDLSIARIYNRALSATEILTNYDNTKGRFGL